MSIPKPPEWKIIPKADWKSPDDAIKSIAVAANEAYHKVFSMRIGLGLEKESLKTISSYCRSSDKRIRAAGVALMSSIVERYADLALENHERVRMVRDFANEAYEKFHPEMEFRRAWMRKAKEEKHERK